MASSAVIGEQLQRQIEFMQANMNKMMTTITDNLRVVSDHQYELQDRKNADKDLNRRLEL